MLLLGQRVHAPDEARPRICEAIPLDRLLIETDLPEETSIDACAEGSQTCKQATEAAEAHYASMLEEAYREIVTLRGEDALDAITRNVRKIFR